MKAAHSPQHRFGWKKKRRQALRPRLDIHPMAFCMVIINTYSDLSALFSFSMHQRLQSCLESWDRQIGGFAAWTPLSLSHAFIGRWSFFRLACTCLISIANLQSGDRLAAWHLVGSVGAFLIPNLTCPRKCFLHDKKIEYWSFWANYRAQTPSSTVLGYGRGQPTQDSYAFPFDY